MKYFLSGIMITLVMLLITTNRPKHICPPNKELHDELGTRNVYRRIIKWCNKGVHKSKRRRALDNPAFRFDR